MGIDNIEALISEDDHSNKQIEIRVSYNTVNGVWNASVFEDGWNRHFSTFKDDEALLGFIRGQCIGVKD